jgi:N-acetylglucosamine-6-sulfatase
VSKALLTVLALVSAAAVAMSMQTVARGSAEPGGGVIRQSSRPNVVVLMTDDETVQDMAVMPRTRALLGAHGVTFARSYVSYPVCCPSRATFFSGQYAHNHRVMGLYPPTGGYARFNRWNSLPVWLERAGYVTAHIGKYLNGYGTQVPADVPPGWTEWHGAVDGSTYRMWGYTLNENGRRRTYGSPFAQDPRLYQTDVYSRKAVDFIKRRASGRRPFFLSVAFLAPHHESASIRAVTGKLVRPAPRDARSLANLSLEPTRAFDEADMTDKPPFLRRTPLRLRAMDRIAEHFRQRQRSLLAVDDAVQAIVDALREQGELRNTYILFTSDNGYMQGEHDVPSGKMLPYDPSTQVPLLLRGPGIPSGQVSDELVGNVDLAPTIVQIAGPAPVSRSTAARSCRSPGARLVVLAARSCTRPGDCDTSRCGIRTRTGRPLCAASSAIARFAPTAGSTWSTATAPVSCTTSPATPTSCIPTTPTRRTVRFAARSIACCTG